MLLGCGSGASAGPGAGPVVPGAAAGGPGAGPVLVLELLMILGMVLLVLGSTYCPLCILFSFFPHP